MKKAFEEGDKREESSERIKAFEFLLDRCKQLLPFNCIAPPRCDIFNHFKEWLTNPVLEECKARVYMQTKNAEIMQYIAKPAKWRAEKEAKLLGLLGEGSFMRKDLELATTVFHCRGCDEHIWYPRVLVHDCTGLKPRWSYPVIQTSTVPMPMDLTFGKVASEAIGVVLRLLHFDPRTTTSETLLSLDVLLMMQSTAPSQAKNAPLFSPHPNLSSAQPSFTHNPHHISLTGLSTSPVGISIVKDTNKVVIIDQPFAEPLTLPSYYLRPVARMGHPV